jgi:hypothetical protein
MQAAMRPNIICSLFTFGGSIVLAILATKIHDYESWFWVAAAICFVAAFVILVAPWASSIFLAYWGRRQTKAQQEQHNEPLRQEIENVAPERAPLLDIIAMATKAGWNTDAQQSNDASELTARLNQAAADGAIKFWGRKYEYDLGEGAATTFPLVDIPAEHFREFSFQPLNLFRGGQINFYIYTGTLGRQMRELRGRIYQDIHACRVQLVEWMSQNTKNGCSKD